MGDGGMKGFIYSRGIEATRRFGFGLDQLWRELMVRNEHGSGMSDFRGLIEL